MNINQIIVTGGKNTNNEFQIVSSSDLTQLRETAAKQSEEQQALKRALEKLAEDIETKNTGAARRTASKLMEDIASGTAANVLSASVLNIIRGLANLGM